MPQVLHRAQAALNHPLARFLAKLGMDAALAVLAWLLLAQALDPGPLAAISLPLWVFIVLFFSMVFQLQRQHYRFTNRHDIIRIFIAIAPAIGISTLAAGLASMPSGFKLYYFLICVGCATGLLWILLRSALAEAHDLRSSTPAVQEAAVTPLPALILGAGHAGHLILQEILRHPELGYRVAGFVDDAPEKRGIRIHGTPVLGATADLPRLVKRFAISHAILAIPSAPGQTIRSLTQLLASLGVEVKTVPGLFNLLGGQPWIPEIKDVAIEDLLRRAPVSLDQTSLREAIQGTVVLITGGGGSIGSELARQAAAFRPARIVLLGRGENSLWEAELQLRALFPGQALTLELCDIRNPARLAQAFETWRPDLVLHAAAHKHVPILEQFPCEAVGNNILGTLNVVRETRRTGCATFVNISTDKAVNPTNVLGASKYVAECLVVDASRGAACGQRFISVRFGNVLGSRGSVIPVFRDQIRRGGPLTVTHPDVTRYFMTIPEASQLVLQAGILGDNGRVYALDMGDPVRICDLASDMARLSGMTPGQDIELRFTGLRPGEKLFEEVFHADEAIHCRVHPKIFEGARAPLDGATFQAGLSALTRALALPAGERQREILAWLKVLVPTYRPSPLGLGRFEGGRKRTPTGSCPS